MPLNETSGNLTTDAFGGGVAVVPAYIEEVFSTYLYTGNGSTQTITNNIDLSTKGGLVWNKNRTTAGYDHVLFDTLTSGTGASTKWLNSNTTNSFGSNTGNLLSSYNTTGFTFSGTGGGYANNSGEAAVSWTFRKQPKFFDVVTYTGTGSNRTISHSLGSVPGCIMVKRTDTTSDWQVYHSSLANTEYLVLNTTDAKATGATRWNSTTPTSTVFSVGTDATVNASGGTYVAYIYASNAGGFGLTGTDNVISCGSFTCVGNVATVNLGYEPQWIINKVVDSTGGWLMTDVMRGMPTAGSDNQQLFANTADAEYAGAGGVGLHPTATGFTVQGFANKTYIYIAIRRGPMKVPTDATKVYNGIARDGTGSSTTITGVGFPPDWVHAKSRTLTKQNLVIDRLRGGAKNLLTDDTTSEQTSQTATAFNQDGITVGADAEYAGINALSGYPYINHFFRRAPSFFDEVCYTGTGSNTTQTHNLAKIPELIIVKERDVLNAWQVYSSALANTEYLVLNTTAAKATGATRWNSTTPTSTVFSIGTDATVNTSAGTYVAYLFATCAGVSKVGSYTGTGATQTINCGFTGGARFVLVKRTDSTGDWYVWDTARGMVSGTDPSLLLNSNAAEVNANSIYTATTGFQIVSTAAGINASGGTYIYFSVA